jgi:hypothetical protein
MGVSFYAVLEYVVYESPWSFGRLNISRDYDLFAAIAFGDGGITEGMPYPPRGLPPKLSLDSRDLFFTEPDVVKEYLEVSRLEDEEASTLEDYLEGWDEWAIREHRAFGLLPTPETYSHRWLNLNELKEALAHRNLSLEKRPPEVRAVIAAMEVLAQEYNPENVRLVFCFGM